MLYKLKFLIKYYSANQLKILYYSLVESHLTYGIVVWAAAYQCDISKLETLHRIILKVIFNKPRLYPTDELHLQTGIFDMKQVYFLKVILY